MFCFSLSFFRRSGGRKKVTPLRFRASLVFLSLFLETNNKLENVTWAARPAVEGKSEVAATAAAARKSAATFLPLLLEEEEAERLRSSRLRRRGGDRRAACGGIVFSRGSAR